jgi:uncharacterized membrane protein
VTRRMWNRIYREVDARASRGDRAEGPARAALLFGVLLSALLLSVGMALVLARGEIRPAQPSDVADTIRGAGNLRGVSLLYVGLVVLAATPILRVLVMTGVYLRRHEWFMLGVSLIVLLLLCLAMLLGTG